MEVLTLGNKIKNRRKKLGLTLKELAGDRVTPAQLSYVETDKCKPSLDLLEYIAEKLGLEMNYLLESEKKQVSRFCEYNMKLCEIDIKKSKYKLALKRAVQVAQVSEAYGLDYYGGEAERFLGDIAQSENDFSSANDYYFKALYKFSRIDNGKKIAQTYMGLGLTMYKKRHFNSSLGYFKQAERFAEDLHDTEMVLKLEVSYYIMKAYSMLEMGDEMFLYADKVSEKLNYVNDANIYGDALMMMARSFEDCNQYEYALEFADKSLCVLDGMNDIRLIAAIETTLGIVYSRGSMTEESIKHLYRAIDIKRASQDDTLPLTLIAAASSFIVKEDYDRVFKMINEALNMSIRTGKRDWEAFAYNQLYKAYYKKGDFIKAEECIRRCSDMLEETDRKEEMAGCYVDMAKFYRSINREREAFDYVIKAVDLYKSKGIIHHGV